MARGDGNVYFQHSGECRDARQHRGCTGRWRGVVNRTEGGKRRRYAVDGDTKTEATKRLKAKVAELDQGIRPDGTYTVRQCCEEWLDTRGPGGRWSDKTLTDYAGVLAPVLAVIGGKRLDRLTVADVERALQQAAATRSTRTVQIAALSLERAVQRAVKHRLVSVNVAALADRPQGKTEGRKSNAMTIDVARRLLRWCADEESMIGDYATVAMLTGCRPEELRALTWDHVDMSSHRIDVWRSVRASGDTKTPKSRRSIIVAPEVTMALVRQQQRQQEQRAAAAEMWTDTGLVFATELGTGIESHDLNRRFKRLCKRASIGDRWSVRELRHTYASLASAVGQNIDQIGVSMGHASSRTTEVVYRKVLRPAEVGHGIAAAIAGELTA